MKTFNSIREETLEEKLKASDPAGKYIRFFDPVPSVGVYGTIAVTIISGFDK